jgi:hypothetical protein
MALGAVLACCLALVGCGGGSGGGGGEIPRSTPQSGQVAIGVTDVAGDFLTYMVDVRSIALARANGEIVQTIPLTTRIDFAELADLTELLTVATVPGGTYTSVTMTLDFTNAQIVVQDEQGNAVAATAVDANGNPLGVLDVRVQLDASDTIDIARGIPANVTLDFDLEASNEVTFGASAVTVAVQPFLLVTAEFEPGREHRVRGLLKDVNRMSGEVTLAVRPFRQRDGAFGDFTFDTSDTTRYEVDGTSFTGDDGLAALAALADGAPVVAHGAVAERLFTADVVLAGSSVPGADSEVVRGVIAARTGNELTVKGALVDFGQDPTVFRGTVKMLVSDATRVTAPFFTDATLDLAALSIGTRIAAVGNATRVDELDATAGSVHVSISDLAATVVTLDPLVVQLLAIDGRRPELFDFTGTGSTPANDSDPERYEIDTGSLVLGQTAAADLVRLRGLVGDFGTAPPDFHARTLIHVDLDNRVGVFVAGWEGGTNSPFVASSPTRLDLNLSDARHLLTLFGVPSGFENPDALALVAPSDRGSYAVFIPGQPSVRLFAHFSEMVTAVTDRLDEGDKLRRLTAEGSYNAAARELVTRRASVELIAP